MPTLTHGSVTVERKLNTGDYSHKLANITLSFTLNEGDDTRAVTEQVADTAMRVALVTVGEAERNPNVIETEISAPPAASRSRKPAKKDAPVPLADPMTEAGNALLTAGDAMGAPVATPSQPQASSDPMGAAPVETIPAATQPSNAAMGGTVVLEKATPVTDGGPSADDLTREVMKVMVLLTPVYGNEVAAAKCTELLTEFGGPGGVTTIPVDKRQEFLARLKVLA